MLPSYALSDSEEYRVYSTIINSWVDESKLLFILDRTSDSYSPHDLLQAYQQQREPHLSKVTLLDFKRKNAQAREISQDLDLHFPYKLLNRDAVEEIFKEGCSGWCKFLERYPEAGGYISISRVGFNQMGTQALVYIAYGCGGLCGSGGYMVLAKENGLWKIKGGLAVWDS